MTTARKKYHDSIASLNNAEQLHEEDRQRIESLCNAYDKNDMTSSPPRNGEEKDDTKEKEANTLHFWCDKLKLISRRLDHYGHSLSTATADDINRLMSEMSTGRHPDVKDSGLKNNTIRNFQGCARRFYFYHKDLDVDRQEIPLVTSDKTHVDGRDMLTRDEIATIRDAADHPRDRCIFDLLLYTGQRNTAVRSLRIKDVDLEESVYYLNKDAEGLKGADVTGSKRPLLGAEGSIRDWLEYHPYSDDPEAYLITRLPRYANVEPYEMVSRDTLVHSMNKLKEKAGIEKPLNPHNIRHNFVTIAKRDYGLDNTNVKYLIGHKSDSTIMESTYAHLSEEDHIKAAQEGAGLRESEEESPLTPEFCHACRQPLGPDDKACSRCGMVYTPDAHSAQQKIEDDIMDDMIEADEPEAREELAALKKLADEKPEMLLEALKDL